MSNLWIITRREDGTFNANPVTEENFPDVIVMFAEQEHWIAEEREEREETK